MNVRIVLLAALVAVIGAGVLLMCDDSDAAGDVLKSGSCGASLTYEVRSLNADDSQVELVISGSGAMSGWQHIASVPWNTYRSQIMTVTLPEGLTSIGSYAFEGCTSLALLTELPAGITSIGNYAFRGCTSLALLTELPAGITSIGYGVFEGCTSLALLTELPAGITSIRDSAFFGCTSLALTGLPAGVTSIESYAFSGCTSLALTGLPAGITSIGNSAFSGCTSLALSGLPAGITSIGNYAFRGCTSLALSGLPAGITSIGSSAFEGCTQIKAMTMPAVITTSTAGLYSLTSLTYTTSADWTSSNRTYSPQYSSRATLQSITFADDRIPAYALYGQNLDRLTITNADGADVLGIYTVPGTRATAQDLTVNGLAAQIVRLADVSGSAELADGRITADDVTIGWEITPEEYGGETTASPDVLIYPAEVHSREPNDYGAWMTAIGILLVAGLIMALILPMIARRLD